MIKLKDGTILRNLEEQVQYLTAYHDENLGIAQWGIRVVDQIDNAEDLPIPYDGEYGDAIAVGTEPPYFFYIWTRNAVAGEPGYWFDYGEISIVGPEGPKGDKGDPGPVGQSTRWFAGSTPSPGSDWDLFLDTSTGNVFQYYNNDWNPIGNIRGPQGIQGRTGPQGIQGPIGPQGEQGPVGPMGKFLKIAGIITDLNQLPTPSSLNDLTVAYLLKSGEIYNLWMQVGDNSTTATWRDLGRFNEGTAVYSNSAYQAVWDADTKVDKKTVASEQILTLKPGGVTDTLAFSADAIPYYIVRRYSGGEIIVPLETAANNHATSKAYVDSKVSSKLDKVTTAGQARLYFINMDGSQGVVDVRADLEAANSVARRTGTGALYVATPTNGRHAATKQYVDDYALAKDTSTTDYNQVYVKAANGGQGTINVTKQALADAVIQRQSDGNVYVPLTPAEDADATSKKYVDDQSVVSLRYTFELLGGTTTLVSYFTMNRKQYNALEPYEYFINKDITSAAKGLPAYCEECGVFSTVYWDPANDIFKCAMNPDDEYEMIEMQEM